MAWKNSASILISRLSYGSAHTPNFASAISRVFQPWAMQLRFRSDPHQKRWTRSAKFRLASCWTQRWGLWCWSSDLTRRSNAAIPAKLVKIPQSEMRETIKQTAWRQVLRRANWQRNIWTCELVKFEAKACVGAICISAFGFAYG